MSDWIQQNFPDIYRIGMQGANSWPDAIYATLYMTVISFIIGGLLGLIMGLFLVLTGPRGIIENKFIFQILDKITSIFRAIPFIILLAILKDFTYFIVGTNLGKTAALVPLSAATFPFFARQVQVVLAETAMAGAIGSGGLGYIAIYYGYNRSSTSVTILATFLILILIFLIQFLGDFLTRKLSHK